MLVNIKVFDDGPFMVCRLSAANADRERSAGPRNIQDKLRSPKCGPSGMNFVAREVVAHE